MSHSLSSGGAESGKYSLQDGRSGWRRACPGWTGYPKQWERFVRTAREMRVEGTVQGVGFRWTAKRIADRLGLAGWVRNNPEGSVSIVIEGPRRDIDEFAESLGDAMGMYIHSLESRDIPSGKYRDGFDVVH